MKKHKKNELLFLFCVFQCVFFFMFLLKFYWFVFFVFVVCFFFDVSTLKSFWGGEDVVH